MLKVNILPLGRMSANCCIVYDEATLIGAVIDPGGEDSAGTIVERCEKLGVKIKYILLTHAHFDHMLSLEELRKITGAPVALHRDDAESLCNPQLTYMAQFAGINSHVSPAEITLADGDKIEIGTDSLEVMHTPGHTEGSVCYKAADFIITGDTLFRGSVGRCDLYGGDEDAMQYSLKKLHSLSGDYKLYPGHGGTATLEKERQTNVYMKHFRT